MKDIRKLVESSGRSSIREKTQAWDVHLGGKHIDTVFHDTDDAEEVRRSLVNHDGYHPDIKVRRNNKYTPKRAPALPDKRPYNIMKEAHRPFDEATSGESKEVEISYRVPGKGGFQRKKFPSQDHADKFVSGLKDKEGEDVEVRWAADEATITEAFSPYNFLVGRHNREARKYNTKKIGLHPLKGTGAHSVTYEGEVIGSVHPTGGGKWHIRHTSKPHLNSGGYDDSEEAAQQLAFLHHLNLGESTLTEPSTYVSKFPDGEEKWKKAKEAASKQGKGEDYGYVTGIFKKMVGESENKNESKSKEELVFPRKAYSGEGAEIDNSEHITGYKVGGHFASHAAAPGYGKRVHKITKIDDKGIWGTKVSDTIRAESIKVGTDPGGDEKEWAGMANRGYMHRMTFTTGEHKGRSLYSKKHVDIGATMRLFPNDKFEVHPIGHLRTESVEVSEADFNSWPHAGWWKSKEELAKGMTTHQLHYARHDAHKAAKANPDNEGKYHDEMSVYWQELRKRGMPTDQELKSILSKKEAIGEEVRESHDQRAKMYDYLVRTHGLSDKDANKFLDSPHGDRLAAFFPDDKKDKSKKESTEVTEGSKWKKYPNHDSRQAKVGDLVHLMVSGGSHSGEIGRVTRTDDHELTINRSGDSLVKGGEMSFKHDRIFKIHKDVPDKKESTEVNEEREKLIIPRMLHTTVSSTSSGVDPVDMSRHISKHKVGDHITGYLGGKDAHKVTRIDDEGVWGKRVSHYDEGTKESQVNEALKSENKDWGFYGTIAKNHWDLVGNHLVHMHGMDHIEARDFLDSPHGRHLADQITSSLPDEHKEAIAKHKEAYIKTRKEKRGQDNFTTAIRSDAARRSKVKESVNEAGYELFYSTGGHGGPHPTLDAARKHARAMLDGNRHEAWIKIHTSSTPRHDEVPVEIVRRHSSTKYFEAGEYGDEKLQPHEVPVSQGGTKVQKKSCDICGARSKDNLCKKCMQGPEYRDYRAEFPSLFKEDQPVKEADKAGDPKAKKFKPGDRVRQSSAGSFTPVGTVDSYHPDHEDGVMVKWDITSPTHQSKPRLHPEHDLY